MTIYLNDAQVMELHHRVMAQSGGLAGVRDADAAQASLQQPLMTFDQQEFYSTLTEKAAALGSSLIQNHPFINGNKRIGHHAAPGVRRLS